MPALIDYAVPGPLTDLNGVRDNVLPRSADPLALCGLARGLVVRPPEAEALGLPAARLGLSQVRPAAALVAALLALDPAPLDVARPPRLRVVGTCRHAAVLTVALLRRAGVAARARCGFATYLVPGRGVDHWVVEYRTSPAGGWLRVDRELLRPGPAARQFPSAGLSRAAAPLVALDPSRFGVAGTRDAWGPAEIKGSTIRDLAALNKVEVLPWDEWGRMADAYAGRAGLDHDALVDTVAAVCGADDAAFVGDLYAREELRVPEHLLR